MKVDPRRCAGAAAFGLIGERYSPQIIREVSMGFDKFDELARGTGAPRDILTARLKTLVGAGVLDRVQYSDRPPRYRYGLTESGRALFPVMNLMLEWGTQWLGETPCATMQHHDHAIVPVLTCSACGQPVHPDDVDVHLRI